MSDTISTDQRQRALASAAAKALDITEDAFSPSENSPERYEYLKTRIRLALMQFYSQGAVDALTSLAATLPVKR